MKHSLKYYATSAQSLIETIVFKYLFLTSILLTAILNPILFLWISLNVRDLLPHIITFESCTLALLAIIFSIALGLKDGAVYNVLISKGVEAVKSAYWRIYFCCLAAIFSIVIAIIILGIDSWTILWLRIVVQSCGLISFLYSLLGTVHLLFYFTFLMVEDTSRSNNRPLR